MLDGTAGTIRCVQSGSWRAAERHLALHQGGPIWLGLHILPAEALRFFNEFTNRASKHQKLLGHASSQDTPAQHWGGAPAPSASREGPVPHNTYPLALNQIKVISHDIECSQGPSRPGTLPQRLESPTDSLQLSTRGSNTCTETAGTARAASTTFL